MMKAEPHSYEQEETKERVTYSMPSRTERDEVRFDMVSQHPLSSFTHSSSRSES